MPSSPTPRLSPWLWGEHTHFLCSMPPEGSHCSHGGLPCMTRLTYLQAFLLSLLRRLRLPHYVPPARLSSIHHHRDPRTSSLPSAHPPDLKYSQTQGLFWTESHSLPLLFASPSCGVLSPPLHMDLPHIDTTGEGHR